MTEMLLTGPQSKQMNWWLQNFSAWLYLLFLSRKDKICNHQSCKYCWILSNYWPDFNEISWEPLVFSVMVGCFFSSPEPKAPRWAVSIPMTPASIVCRPSVHQHFQTSSSLKPLGQLNSNFIWRLLRMGEPKLVQMVLVTWPRWPPCPYMVKTL